MECARLQGKTSCACSPLPSHCRLRISRSHRRRRRRPIARTAATASILWPTARCGSTPAPARSRSAAGAMCDAKEVGPIELAEGIANAHNRSRKCRKQEIRRLRAYENVGPRPFAQCARESTIEEKGCPMLLVETVATHPDRQEIEVACCLEEVPRQRHAVLERDTCLSGRLRHGVHEPLARGQIAFRHCRAGKPVLFVRTNARSPEITHPAGPQAPVGGYVARDGIFFSVGTAVIDPAIVRDKR